MRLKLPIAERKFGRHEDWTFCGANGAKKLHDHFYSDKQLSLRALLATAPPTDHRLVMGGVPRSSWCAIKSASRT